MSGYANGTIDEYSVTVDIHLLIDKKHPPDPPCIYDAITCGYVGVVAVSLCFGLGLLLLLRRRSREVRKKYLSLLGAQVMFSVIHTIIVMTNEIGFVLLSYRDGDPLQSGTEDMEKGHARTSLSYGNDPYTLTTTRAPPTEQGVGLSETRDWTDEWEGAPLAVENSMTCMILYFWLEFMTLACFLGTIGVRLYAHYCVKSAADFLRLERTRKSTMWCWFLLTILPMYTLVLYITTRSYASAVEERDEFLEGLGGDSESGGWSLKTPPLDPLLYFSEFSPIGACHILLGYRISMVGVLASYVAFLLSMAHCLKSSRCVEGYATLTIKVVYVCAFALFLGALLNLSGALSYWWGRDLFVVVVSTMHLASFYLFAAPGTGKVLFHCLFPPHPNPSTPNRDGGDQNETPPTSAEMADLLMGFEPGKDDYFHEGWGVGVLDYRGENGSGDWGGPNYVQKCMRWLDTDPLLTDSFHTFIHLMKSERILDLTALTMKEHVNAPSEFVWDVVYVTNFLTQLKEILKDTKEYYSLYEGSESVGIVAVPKSGKDGSLPDHLMGIVNAIRTKKDNDLHYILTEGTVEDANTQRFLIVRRKADLFLKEWQKKLPEGPINPKIRELIGSLIMAAGRRESALSSGEGTGPGRVRADPNVVERILVSGGDLYRAIMGDLIEKFFDEFLAMMAKDACDLNIWKKDWGDVGEILELIRDGQISQNGFQRLGQGIDGSMAFLDVPLPQGPMYTESIGGGQQTEIPHIQGQSWSVLVQSHQSSKNVVVGGRVQTSDVLLADGYPEGAADTIMHGSADPRSPDEIYGTHTNDPTESRTTSRREITTTLDGHEIWDIHSPTELFKFVVGGVLEKVKKSCCPGSYRGLEGESGSNWVVIGETTRGDDIVNIELEEYPQEDLERSEQEEGEEQSPWEKEHAAFAPNNEVRLEKVEERHVPGGEGVGERPSQTPRRQRTVVLPNGKMVFPTPFCALVNILIHSIASLQSSLKNFPRRVLSTCCQGVPCRILIALRLCAFAPQTETPDSDNDDFLFDGDVHYMGGRGDSPPSDLL